MPANVSPIFARTGRIDSVLITAANTSSQGGGTIGTDIFEAFTADTSNGSFIRYVRLIATGTTANTTTTATVGRIFISSVTSGATTSANTWLVSEVTLPAVQADSSTVGSAYIDVPINAAIQASYTILITNHAAPAANTAWRAVVFAGDY